MRKDVLRYLNLYWAGLIMLTFSSCMNPKTVSRNYEFATDDTCDCYTKHPVILVGTKSNYYSKEKAFCTRSNFNIRNDSIVKLKNLIFQFESTEISEDSIEIRVNAITGIIDKLETGWTHSKIKTKWKSSSEGTQILKQKVKFYNKFKFGRKFVGMRKYKNGSLIKIKFEERIHS